MEIKDSTQLRNEYFNFSYNDSIKEKDKIILEKKLLKLREEYKITLYDYNLFHTFVLNEHGISIIDAHIPEIMMRRIYSSYKYDRLEGKDDVWIDIQNSLAETYKLLEETEFDE